MINVSRNPQIIKESSDEIVTGRVRGSIKSNNSKNEFKSLNSIDNVFSDMKSNIPSVIEVSGRFDEIDHSDEKKENAKDKDEESLLILKKDLP